MAFGHTAPACLLSIAFVASLAAQAPDKYGVVRQALELYRTGDCRNAEVLLRKTLLDEPKNIAARKLLGNCLLRDKKIDEARDQFQQVLEDAPQDFEAFQGLRGAVKEIQKRLELRQSLAIEARAATAEEFRSGHEFETAGKLIKDRKLDEAEKILEGIIARRPDSVPARRRLAEIYTTTGRYDKAVEEYRILAEKPGASSIFLLRMAQNFAWAENYAEAARNYRLYLKKKPDDLTSRMALANVFMWSEQYREAIAEFKLLLAKRPDNLAARITLANALIWSGRYREAIPEFERLRVKKPRDIQIPLALAQCYEHEADVEQALKAYEIALELNPTNPAALGARARLTQFLDQLPRQRAFAALERKDYEAAANLFARYLQKHPDSNETLLQIARVYSWGNITTEAEHYYEEYLGRAPQDLTARRELARMEMWTKNYAAAREQYKLLVEGPAASSEDYETLIQAYLWPGDLAGAQPYAAKLAALEPGNPLAREILADFTEQQRLVARAKAEELTAAGRYLQAVEAYRQYMDTYGKDPRLELVICRLYSWNKDFDHSIEAYRQYLSQHPQDLAARVELANVENWAAQYEFAEADYRAVLEQNPREVAAIVGLAQVMDYQGKDPFRVRDSFLEVLKVEPRNPVAQKRLEEIHPLVAPTLSLSQSDFSDSDGFIRSSNTVAVTFPLPGRIKITPFYTFGYFHQAVTGQDTRALGNGGGARIGLSPNSRLDLLGELGGFDWSQHQAVGTVNSGSSRTSLNARFDASFRPSGKDTLGISYAHRDAAYDVNTAASLPAGIMGDTFLISYQRPLAERVRFWATGGMSHYSSGTLANNPSNTQPRASARLDYLLRPWIKLGYSFRGTGFASPSALYFSPSLYQTHGLAYGLDHGISRRLRFTADGEVDYGRIATQRSTTPIGVSTTLTGAAVNTFEFAVAPGLRWRVRRNLVLQLGYRFSRGRAGSAFSAPGSIYRTHGGEINLSKVF